MPKRSSASARSGMMGRVARSLKKILPKWLRKPELEYINGYIVRRGMITCPVCGVPPDMWCVPQCQALDLMDYR